MRATSRPPRILAAAALAVLLSATAPAASPEDMPDADLKKGLELMAMMTPAKVTIDDGYVKGDAAVLYVSGTEEGQKQYATIRLTRSAGAWRVGAESWSDKPPSK